MAASNRSLFEDETSSDLVILVGKDSEQQRIPAHSGVLAKNELLWSKIREIDLAEGDTKKHIYLWDDPPKGFRNFIKWMYGYECSPSSMEIALDTLQVSLKYSAGELSDVMVKYLDDNFTSNNLLRVIIWGYRYTSLSKTTRNQPSAPPMESDLPPPYPGDDHSRPDPPSYESIFSFDDMDPSNKSSTLVQNWFRLLDLDAETILAEEALEECSAKLLKAILKRDTLNIKSESTVVSALFKWSGAECRRKKLRLDIENRREVLGKLILLPRILVQPGVPRQQLSSIYYKDEIEFAESFLAGQAFSSPVPEIFADNRINDFKRVRTPERNSGQKGTKSKKEKKDKKKYSASKILWEVFSAFAHMID